MSEAGSEEEMVIRVRGLPWSATADDIIEFFEGIAILEGEKGIHMTVSREGRPSGEAYVELADADDIEAALKKHNEHMGDRYIEVFKAKRSQMEWVVKRESMGPPAQEDECCLRLRGVPFGCSKEEIMTFFSGLEIVANGIALPTDYQGKHTGEAYVQFVNKETTQKAMEKHKEKIAHRYIEIFKSNMNEISCAMSPKMRGQSSMGGFNRPSPYNARDRFGRSNKYNSGGRGGRGGRSFDFDDSPSWGNNHFDSWSDRRSRGMGSKSFRDRMDDRGLSYDGHYVHMRGLPFRATEMDVVDFFSPIDPINITIQMDNSNRPSGEADVEFSSHEEAVKSMDKDKAKMQHRYIELFLNSSQTSQGPYGSISPLMSSGSFGGGGNMGNGGYGSGNMGGGGGGGGGFGSNMGNGGFNSGGFNQGMGRMGGGGGGSMMGRRYNDDMNGSNNSQNYRPGGGGGFNSYSGQNQMGGNNYNSFC